MYVQETQGRCREVGGGGGMKSLFWLEVDLLASQMEGGDKSLWWVVIETKNGWWFGD